MGCGVSLFDTIDCLALAHEEFSPATLRQYSAALAMAIDFAEELGELDDKQVLACRERLTHRPAPRKRGAEKRTSAKKRKSMCASELRAVGEALRKRGRAGDMLLLRLLINNVVFGLRPSEYSGAEVGEIYLVVQTAKATNGRALSETRELELEGLPDGQIESLCTLIADLETAAQGNVPALIDSLGARLRRACKSAGIEPFSLYTTRHQAIANLKGSGSAEEVAAFAGQGSIHTARKSYAPRSAAWSIKKTVRASPDMVELVRARQASRMALQPKL
ncbi:MAG: integrase [Devosia sp.]|nr:integrase [Devosia sp.]